MMLAATILFAGHAEAQDLSTDPKDYPRMKELMDTRYPDLTWEVHTVYADDGYIVPIYRVWDKKTRDSSKGPVAFQHGGGMDGAFWMQYMPDVTTQMQLVEDGHEVWLANSRGTEYATAHKTLDRLANPAEYWDFSW